MKRLLCVAFLISASAAFAQVPDMSGTGQVSPWFPRSFLGLGNSGSPVGYQLDIRDSTNRTGIHLRSAAITDTGGYITSEASDEIMVSGGVAFDGTNWIAKAGAAGIVGHSAGVLHFYEDGALTPGNPYTPTERFRIALTSAIFSNLSTVRPLSGAATDLGTASFTWNNIFTNVGLIDAGGVTRFGMPTAATTTINSTVVDAASAVAFLLNTSTALTGAANRYFLQIQNFGSNITTLDTNGQLATASLTSLTPSSGLTLAGRLTLTSAAATSLDYKSFIADGAAQIGHNFDTNAAYANATAKIFRLATGGVEKYAIDLNGKEIIPTGGGAAVVGTSAAMTAGAVTISTTAVTASSKIFYNVHTAGGTQGFLRVSAVVAGTSFTISSTAAETSTIDWRIVN